VLLLLILFTGHMPFLLHSQQHRINKLHNANAILKELNCTQENFVAKNSCSVRKKKQNQLH